MTCSPAQTTSHRARFCPAAKPGPPFAQTAYITADLLQRSDHRSVQAPEADIRAWIAAWNDNRRPFIWTKTAEQIVDKLGRLLQRINGGGY